MANPFLQLTADQQAALKRRLDAVQFSMLKTSPELAALAFTIARCLNDLGLAKSAGSAATDADEKPRKPGRCRGRRVRR